MRRRSFFQWFAQFAAIDALAPQLAFRTKPLEFRPVRAEDFEWEFFTKILTVWDGGKSPSLTFCQIKGVADNGYSTALEKRNDVGSTPTAWSLATLIFCFLCLSARAQVIQVTCPTRTVPGTYTNQTNAGFIVQTVTTPVVNGTVSHYYNSGITNLPNVFKNVPSECTIRTNYRQATLKVLRPRAVRMSR